MREWPMKSQCSIIKTIAHMAGEICKEYKI